MTIEQSNMLRRSYPVIRYGLLKYEYFMNQMPMFFITEISDPRIKLMDLHVNHQDFAIQQYLNYYIHYPHNQSLF